MSDRAEDVIWPTTRLASFEAGGTGTKSPGPDPFDLSEYMIGRVAVATFLPESNGTIDPDLEEWTDYEESLVMLKTQQALNWWTLQEPRAHLSFVRENHLRVPTGYEPVSRPSSDDHLWIEEIMAGMGYTSGDHTTRLRSYLNGLRVRLGTDWAFAMFIVHSRDRGFFTNGLFAYAYIGGPYLVMTSGNGWSGPDNFSGVAAHETGHIFYATDEYNGHTDWSGYLDAPDSEGSTCLMDTPTTSCLSEGTRLQIGWRDADSDGKLDILGVPPETALVDSLDLLLDEEEQADYSGIARVVPLHNQNPFGPRNDVTISRIERVEWRVDGGSWNHADAELRAFSTALGFTINELPGGYHSIEVRAWDTEGNVDPTPAQSFTVVVTLAGGSSIRLFAT